MITQGLTPFDSTKQAIEGTTSFRANASYSWSWLIEHTQQQITLISQINSTVNDMNTLAQTTTTKAQEVANNTAIVNQAKLDTQSARDTTLNAKAAVEAIGGVGLTNLENGDTLEYDSSTSKFKNTNFHSKTAKTTLADADEFMTADSTSTWSLKKITWANIKATLASLFISKVATPTTNALAKIQADGNIKNTGITVDDTNSMEILGTAGSPNYIRFNQLINGGKKWRVGNTGGTGFGDFNILNETDNTTPFTVKANGNILLGTTTDNGVDKLQVNGSISSGEILVYSSGDLNDIKGKTQTIGTYINMSNIPLGDYGYLEVIVYGSSWVMQRFTALGAGTSVYAGRTFVRCFVNGTTWTPWVEK